MKRICFLVASLMALAVLAAPAAASGYIVTIGTHASGNAIPWWGASYNSCRFQCMWLQNQIGYAGYINVVEFEASGSTAGTFNDVRVWLCHTSKTALEATFDNNYTGYTPVQVRTGGDLTFPPSTGYVDLGITPNLFNYNNSNNLLMEVRWNGDSGATCSCWRSNDTTNRIYAWDHNATSGTVQVTGQCIRLHIGTMTTVAPASLGRIKALLR